MPGLLDLTSPKGGDPPRSLTFGFFNEQKSGTQMYLAE